MGVVFKARQTSLNRTVALKMILEGRLAGMEQVERFQREARAAAQLDHPNVVPIYDVGECEGQHYFSMKLIDGQSLMAILQNRDHIPSPRESARIVSMIARAVHYAHERGVLHRDIKPANILLDKEGNPYLTDFGLAKLLDDDASHTATQTLLGTPACMPPEVARTGVRAATIATDIFSLGAVLYQMITGQPLYTGSNSLEVLEKARNGSYARPVSVNPSVSREIEKVCLKCLRYEPEQRYKSMAELAADLERFINGETVLVVPPTVWEITRSWVRRHRLIAGFSAAIFLCLLSGLGLASWQWSRAKVLSGRLGQTTDYALKNQDWRIQRDIDYLWDRGETYQAIRGLVRLVRDNPSNEVASTRLFSALTERAFPWIMLPPMKHDGPVVQVELTVDGLWMVTASRAGDLRLWDKKTGVLRMTLPHDTQAGRFALSPDGRRLATMSTNGSAIIWRLPDAKKEFDLGGPGDSFDSQPGGIICVDFSKDSKLIAGGDRNGAAGVWRLRDGRLLARIQHGKPLKQIRFSPSNSEVLTLGGMAVKTWRIALNPETTNVQPVLNLDFQQPVSSADFSPQGDRLVIASASVVSICDATTGVKQNQYLCKDDVETVLFSPAGNMVGYSGPDCGARVRDLSNNAARLLLFSELSGAMSLRFNQSGSMAVATSSNGFVRLLNLADGNLVTTALQHHQPVYDAALNHTGPQILTGCDDRYARYWNIMRPHYLDFALPVTDHPELIEVSDTLTHVAVSCANRTVRVFAPTAAFHTRPIQHAADITCIQFNYAGKILASGDASGQVMLTLPHRGNILVSSFSHTGAVQSVQWSGNSKWLVVNTPGTITIWPTAPIMEAYIADKIQVFSNIQPAVSLSWTNEGIYRISPDSKRIALAWAPNEVRIFDLATGQPVGSPLQHSKAILDFAFAPDGRTIATGGRKGDTRVWSVETGQPVTPWLRNGSDVCCLGFGSTSSLLVLGGENGTASFWDVDKAQLRNSIKIISKNLQMVALSKDDEWLLVRGTDNNFNLRHVLSGLQGAAIRTSCSFPVARFTRDGRNIVVTGSNGRAVINKTPSSQKPDMKILIKLAEFTLGETINEQGGWDTMSVEQFWSCQNTLTNYFNNRFGPSVQTRSYRAALSKPANP